MHFQQFYLGCLAHASYLIVSDGEAAVVDPQRDVDQYITAAESQGARIRWILETHLHADFVSGHAELAAATGAQIVFGRVARVEFPHHAAADGERLPLGSAELEIIETPGHTPESISILVRHPDEPLRLLTGDTLFIGDVGRPDLAANAEHSVAEMAGMLFDSLQRLLALPDETQVYPAHGAGSLCGRNISSETSSTIGVQRATNHALRPMSREEFVTAMTAALPPQPRYFAHDVEMNRRGAPNVSGVEAPRFLSPADVRDAMHRGAVVLDVRSAASFGEGHIPGSISIGLGGQYASWAGTLVAPDASIVLVTAAGDEAVEARLRLARVGLEGVVGVLDGGVDAWVRAGFGLATVPQMSVTELHERGAGEAMQVIDVREPGEYATGHVPGAVNAPLRAIHDHFERLDPARPTAVICAGGYRSSAATSLFLPRGFTNIVNVVGGTAAWRKAGLPLE